MLKLCWVTKVKVLFLVLVYVFNFNLFEFSAAILEKGLSQMAMIENANHWILKFRVRVLLKGCMEEQLKIFRGVCGSLP